MSKRMKIILVIIAIIAVIAFIFLWVNGFEITKFIPRRGYA